ncbi:MAG: flippase-like domain-containing protein [Actinomycetota bacterium]|nr:flippase-like domain-containing protein [Actinomycetota bacterium]
MSTLRNVLYVVFLGVVLYLLLPQLPGIRRSASVLGGASVPLLVAALTAEILSLLCFSEVLGRSVVAASKMRPSLKERRRSGLGPWFVFRLAIIGLEAGRLLPGGAVLQVGITLDEFRRRGLRAGEVGIALAAGFFLVYGALGVLCATAFVYLLGHRDSASMIAAAVLAFSIFLAAVVLVARVSYSPSLQARFRLGELTYLAQRLLRRGWSRQAAHERASRLVDALRRGIKVTGRLLLAHPSRSAVLAALAFGYWLLDALCLLLVFSALGVGMEPGKLLVAYAVAQLVATLPFMPLGGLGAAEGVFVSLFALLGMSPAETVIPVLCYRLFNYWLPLLLAVIFYPTLRLGAKSARARKVR